MLPNRTDAEEVFQQTSLLLWRKWDEFEPGTDFVSWACTVAHFEVLNYIRRADRRNVALSGDVIELLVKERRVMRDEIDARRDALRVCIDGLPARQRELVEAAYSGVQPINVLATQMGQTANAVYMTLRRIREALGACIRKRLGEIG
jgi:RNA polymerase sigma-70 factor (ECF subfamily)